MIQPIGAFSPRADLRGHGVAFRRTPQEISKKERPQTQVALINASGLSVLIGALTTAISRGYTTSWAHACVLGVFATLLSMSFITPMSVEKKTLIGEKKLSALPVESTKTPFAAKLKKPVKRQVQFRQA